MTVFDTVRQEAMNHFRAVNDQKRANAISFVSLEVNVREVHRRIGLWNQEDPSVDLKKVVKGWLLEVTAPPKPAQK
ncbi:MAG: hypothetical protein ACR2NN_11320 [Bryobacteraceae bacterium]